MRPKDSFLVCALTALCVPAADLRAAAIRVDASAAGAQTGQTWADAFTAIGAALAAASPGDELWVKGGSYGEAIEIPAGIELYGGFAGDEGAREERDWREHESIIDGGGASAAVRCAEGTVVDGFTVTGGGQEGAVVARAASPIIQNCRVSGNGRLGGPAGPALYLYDSAAQILDCAFVDNRAGGVNIGQARDGFVMRGCRVLENWAGQLRASIRISGGTARIEECLIANNLGAAVLRAGCTTVFVSHVTIAANTGAGLVAERCAGDAPVVVADSIAWDNSGGDIVAQGAVSVSYSCIGGATPWPGDGNIGEDPLFVGWGGRSELHVDPSAPAGGDGSPEHPYRRIESVTAAYDFALCGSSPCVGAGQGGSAMGADLGTRACQPQSVPTIVFAPGEHEIGALIMGLRANIAGSAAEATTVRGSITGLKSNCRLERLTFSNDEGHGVSIAANEGAEVADCRFADCAGPGVESSGSEARVVRCTVERCGGTYGGIYAPAGTLTIIDTLIAGNGYNGVLVGKANVTLRGCSLLRNGADLFVGGSSPYTGGGVRVNGGTLLVESSTIEENVGLRGLGGGVFASNGTIRLVDCGFLRNRASTRGGAVSLENSKLTVQGCLFEGNAAPSGGGIHLYQSEGDVAGSVFKGNIAILQGGAARPSQSSTLRLTNVTMVGNCAPAGAGVASGIGSSASLLNCILWENAGGSLGASDGGTVSASFSSIQGGDPWPGEGNLTTDPLFKGWGATEELHVDAGAAPGGDGSAARPFASFQELFGSFSVALCEGSPCIGTGQNGVDRGAVAGAVAGPPSGPVTVRVAAGTCTTGAISIAYRTSIEGSGPQATTIEGSLWGLGEGRSLRGLTVTAANAAGVTAFGSATIENCAFAECGGDGDPGYPLSFGVVRCRGGNVAIRDCAFSRNRRGYPACFGEGLSLEIARTRFEGNEMRAVVAADAHLVVRECLFDGNGSGWYEALSARGGDALIEDCSFARNGRGIALGSLAQGSIRDCAVRGSWTSALKVEDCQNVTVENVAIVENEGAGEAVVSCIRSSCSFDHVTIARNVPVVSGAVWLEEGSPSIVDSIIWGNTAAGIIVQNATPLITFSCIQGTTPWPGQGNVAADPRFRGWGAAGEVHVAPGAEPGGDGSQERPFSTIEEALAGFDYALTAGSPCIGAASDGTSMGAFPEVSGGSGGVSRTVHLAAGVHANAIPPIAENIAIVGAGADGTFIEATVVGLGHGSSLASVCVRGSPARGIVVGAEADPLIEDCTVTECGGGIQCEVLSRPTFRNVIISGNVPTTTGGEASKGGGVCCQTSSTPTFEGVQIIGNSADMGGGVYCAERSRPTFTDCRIADNLSDAGAGLYGAEYSDIAFTRTRMTGNSGDRGAILGAEHARLAGNELEIIGNASDAIFLSSGIMWHGDELTLANSAITGNRELESPNGCAIRLATDGAIRLENTLIGYNGSTLAALYIEGKATVRGSSWFVRGNRGTGICVYGDPVIENGAVIENGGDGIKIFEGAPTVRGCTIANNWRKDIANSDDNAGNLYLDNCIVWNALAPNPLDSPTARVRISYSCVRSTEVWEGRGNINGDPRFLGWGDPSEIFVDASALPPGEGTRDAPFPDLASAMERYRYLLSEGSPCIGAGSGGANMGAGLGVAPGPAGGEAMITCAAGTYDTVLVNLINRASLVGAGSESTTIQGAIIGLRDDRIASGFTLISDLSTGIGVTDARDITLRDLVVTGAWGYYGGGLYCTRSSGRVEGCVFRANESYTDGGGMHVGEGSDFVVTSSVFEGNRAKNGGGARITGKAVFRDCRFLGNHADDSGGGLGGTAIVLEGCAFAENEAGSGGAVTTGGTTSTIIRSRFERNYSRAGAAVNNPTLVRQCDFVHNLSGNYGAACNVWGGATVDGCRFLGNAIETANATGSAVASSSADPKILNCLFVGNTNGAVALRLWDGAQAPLFNCTFHLNPVAFVLSSPKNPTAINSIFWQNGDSPIPVELSHSLADRDPRFEREAVVDFERFREVTFGSISRPMPDFIVDEGDYRLRPDSPALDAGTAEGAPPHDLAGLPRPCGAGVDIGSYESCVGLAAFVRGDANADDDINIADPIFALQFLFAKGRAPTCMDTADANDDGTVNIADPIRLLGRLFGFQPALPLPYPTCGGDPTADPLEECTYAPCERR